MELAAVGEPVALGACAACVEHCRRGVEREEAPAREALRQVRDLGSGARAHAQQPRIVGQAGEHGFEQEVQAVRSEEHTSELPSLMRISYAVFCLKKQRETTDTYNHCPN